MKKNKFSVIMLLLFCLFVIYGTTIPFKFAKEHSFLTNVAQIQRIPFFDNHGDRTSIPDVIQNLILFIPIGFFSFFALIQIRNLVLRSGMSVLIGFSLSFLVEFLQLFTIDRTTSITDLITNTTGTMAGFFAGLVFFTFEQRISVIPSIKNAFSHIESRALIAAMILLACLQLEPFNFSLHAGTVFNKLKTFFSNPLVFSLNWRDSPILFLLSFITATQASKVSANRDIPKLSAGIILPFVMFYSFALVFFQFIVISRTPGISELLTSWCGILSGFAVGKIIKKTNVINGLISIGLVLTILTRFLYPFTFTSMNAPINIIPFLYSCYYTTLNTVSNAFEMFLLFFSTGLFLLYPKGKIARLLFGIILFFSIFILELMQGMIPLRFPDITDVLIATVSFYIGRYVFTRKIMKIGQNRYLQS
jgi:glycopeptide antibiotics resistance protein